MNRRQCIALAGAMALGRAAPAAAPVEADTARYDAVLAAYLPDYRADTGCRNR